MVDYTLIIKKEGKIKKLNIAIFLLILFYILISLLPYFEKNNFIPKIITKSGLYLRVKPNGKIIKKLGYNEQILVLDSVLGKKWIKIVHKNDTGFIWKAFTNIE